MGELLMPDRLFHAPGQPDRAIEWLSAIIMIAWAAVVMQPGDVITAEVLRVMTRGAGEGAIATVFGLVGGLRIAALYINGRWPKTPLIRMLGAGAGFVLWAQVAILFTTMPTALGHAAMLSVAVYGPLALADLFSIYRAAYDARYNGR